MASRISLHSKLKELLGSENVYYKTPESRKMQYTAIVYSKSKIESTHANDTKYINRNRYQVIVISKRPDDPVVQKLLELPYCYYDRSYIADNLYHDSLILYY